MSAISIKNFDKKFISRTQEILNEYNGKRDFTLLINCLVGLLILPREYLEQNRAHLTFDFYSRKVSHFHLLQEIFKDEDMTTSQGEVVKKNLWISKSGKKRNILDITVGNLIGRVRNSIAHAHINPINNETTWEGIVLRNKDKDNGNLTNFETWLTESEVKDLAFFIANKYSQCT